jgi:hypothetical protein
LEVKVEGWGMELMRMPGGLWLPGPRKNKTPGCNDQPEVFRRNIRRREKLLLKS